MGSDVSEGEAGMAERSERRRVVIFDFDGTLTALPIARS
jgi:trehalose-6-phosphatase